MSKFMDWVDARFPATKMWEDHLSKYYAPKNFNFFYFFGSLALLVLVNQIVTGVWLTMSYTPSAEEAFASVEYIMRDVEYGSILRCCTPPALRRSSSWSICTCSVACSTVRTRSRVSWSGSSAC
jgi:hypothetical protein